MQDWTEGQRSLLAEEMLRYFGETCPALAASCDVAIGHLSRHARREIAGHLQTLRAVTNETNRELAAARVAATGDHASSELLFGHALASIEHLSEIAQTVAQRIDELMKKT
jgi:hypothetical protein